VAPSDITIEILKDIRDGVRGTNERLERVEGRLETMDGRLERVEGRLETMDGRLETVEGALLDLAGQHRFVVRYMRGLARRDTRIDGDVADLRVRVEALEVKVEGKRT